MLGFFYVGFFFFYLDSFLILCHRDYVGERHVSTAVWYLTNTQILANNLEPKCVQPAQEIPHWLSIYTLKTKAARASWKSGLSKLLWLLPKHHPKPL